jgi:mRNA-degrading endonuclease RelE of RelBE toxin-antitoxin system
VAYRIEYDPAAEDHLARLSARDEATVLEVVVRHLTHQPAAPTRNRKRMRPNALAPWELRVGALRAYYEVIEKPEKLVTVRAVGIKEKGWVARARKVSVVLTIKGRPVAAITPLDEGDWERLVVSCHPAFRSNIEQSRERCPAGQGISTEEMRRRLKRRRAAAVARPSNRRAPRPARRSRPSKRR